jgi:hypothetical protein
LTVGAPSNRGYLINHEKLTLHIEIMPLNRLKPHEKIIPNEVERLAKSIHEAGMIRDPIIVDQTTWIVLDGMHRLAALRLLRAIHSVVCAVDYRNPAISLGRWFRVITGADSDAVREAAMKTLGEFSTGNYSDPAGFNEGVLLPGGFGISPKAQNHIERLRMLSKLETELQENGARITYESETRAMQTYKSDGSKTLVAFPTLTKDDVIQFASSGQLLPQKTTKHIVPARPLHADISLDVLSSAKLTEPEINRLLLRHLRVRRVDRLAPGSAIDGRVYQEDIYLFSRGAD